MHHFGYWYFKLWPLPSGRGNDHRGEFTISGHHEGHHAIINQHYDDERKANLMIKDLKLLTFRSH